VCVLRAREHRAGVTGRAGFTRNRAAQKFGHPFVIEWRVPLAPAIVDCHASATFLGTAGAVPAPFGESSVLLRLLARTAGVETDAAVT
jgi:hypothetical protein